MMLTQCMKAKVSNMPSHTYCMHAWVWVWAGGCGRVGVGEWVGVGVLCVGGWVGVGVG